jgi:uncharacterized protein YraI
MFRRLSLVVVGCLALLAAPQAAEAASGWTTTTLNLRSGPGTHFPVVTAMPAGAAVEVVNCASWCELYYGRRHGYASARYISLAGYRPVQPVPPVVIGPMPPAIYWQYGRPWWDDRHRAWYDGRRWWYDNGWHARPRSGFSFQFNF